VGSIIFDYYLYSGGYDEREWMDLRLSFCSNLPSSGLSWMATVLGISCFPEEMDAISRENPTAQTTVPIVQRIRVTGAMHLG
jgi:hypothetical protein